MSSKTCGASNTSSRNTVRLVAFQQRDSRRLDGIAQHPVPVAPGVGTGQHDHVVFIARTIEVGLQRSRVGQHVDVRTCDATPRARAARLNPTDLVPPAGHLDADDRQGQHQQARSGGQRPLPRHTGAPALSDPQRAVHAARGDAAVADGQRGVRGLMPSASRSGLPRSCASANSTPLRPTANTPVWAAGGHLGHRLRHGQQAQCRLAGRRRPRGRTARDRRDRLPPMNHPRPRTAAMGACEPLGPAYTAPAYSPRAG